MKTNNQKLGQHTIAVPPILSNNGLIDEEKRTLPLINITLPESQPRRFFDSQKLEQLTKSVREHGILEPLLVRPLKDDIYQLVAGERRFRAAQSVGLEEVPVVIRQLDDKKAYQFALIENLQREDLNPIEETEGLLELLSSELEVERKEIVSIIDQALNAKKRNLELTENVFSQFQTIESILASTSKLTVESFRTARLPLLNLPQDILEILRQGHIEYTKARAIARIKDDKQRKKILKEATEQNLSLSQIRERIGKLKTSQPKNKVNSSDNGITYHQRLKDIYTKAKNKKTLDDPEKAQELEELLDKLEKLF
ncbi:ParB/RepB/Spo0J family partition protein [Tolypothrix sp. VBCCA 56010]|uniref:ParB/RepB/Spo0J family partition protein n=1 Tax=Tolypothrix sp. VBCCA 56010 TaxID=3137731 RepID=UPI003D7EC02E